MKKCVIFTKNSLKTPISRQFRQCRTFAKQRGFDTAYHIYNIKEDSLEDDFTKAVNIVIANQDIQALVIHDPDILFEDRETYLFYCLYLVNLNKELLTVK